MFFLFQDDDDSCFFARFIESLVAEFHLRSSTTGTTSHGSDRPFGAPWKVQVRSWSLESLKG